MSEFYCRGEKRRKNLINTYQIKPITHTILLKGQTKMSAAGDKITKEYYRFSYSNLHESGTFVCGTFVAKNFLKLLDLPSLPIFNPLKADGNIYDNPNKGDTESIQNEKWNSVALELHNVINIILMSWDSDGGILSKILTKIMNNYTKEPELMDIKSVNTIIGKDHKKRSIYEMLNDMKRENDIRDYKFPLVEKIIKENNIIP
jgi:hypothetical protein